tara:strand:- start:3594 stop:4151 length:558 start_codon:yes stop_codon:yes gene_type:complete
MINLINIYNDDESALIIDETSTNLIDVQKFDALGESPFNISDTQNSLLDKNLNFVEMHIFDVTNSLIVTLNSARPLLKKPSTQKFYFGPYHVHQDTYMVGAKHTNIPHETLELVKINQLIPYPLEARYSTDSKKFAIKMSEIFDVLKNIENFTLEKDTKFIIQYGIFEDMFLRIKKMIDTGGAIQ